MSRAAQTYAFCAFVCGFSQVHAVSTVLAPSVIDASVCRAAEESVSPSVDGSDDRRTYLLASPTWRFRSRCATRPAVAQLRFL